MSECTHNCSTCSSNCASRKESLVEKPHELSRVKKVIAVMSGKGGVGKSLVTSLSAVMMQRRGYNTAIIDADITGPSIPKIFGIHERAMGDESGIFPAKSKMGTSVMSVNLLLENETDPVIWRGPVIAGMAKQFWTDVVWGDVDFMFVDMPPGTGDVPLTVFQSLPVDGVIIVTSPQDLVGMVVEKSVKMANALNKPVLAIVENMSYYQCPKCDEKIKVFGESDVKALADKFGVELCAEIPINPKLAAACDKGMIELFDGDWLDAVADKLESLD